MIQMQRVGAGGGVLAQHGKVCRHLPIKQGEFLQFGAGKLSQTATIGLGQESRQPVPMRPPLLNPLV